MPPPPPPLDVTVTLAVRDELPYTVLNVDVPAPTAVAVNVVEVCPDETVTDAGTVATAGFDELTLMVDELVTAVFIDTVKV